MIAMANPARGGAHSPRLRRLGPGSTSHRSLRRDSLLPDGSLLTCNDEGLCRWPVRLLPGNTLRMGPPEPMAPITPRIGSVHLGLAANGNGRVIGVAAPAQQGAMLLDREAPTRRIWLVPHRKVFDLAISPDGKWVATIGYEPSRDYGLVKVWNAANGQLQFELPARSSHAAFSPDSHWFAVYSESRLRLLRTGSWSIGTEIHCGLPQGMMRIAFHPTGRIAALLDTDRPVVRLIEFASGRVVASLESPDESKMYSVGFSPDGRWLTATHSDQRVDVWNLTSIRRQLENLGLATGLPDIFSGHENRR